MKDYVLPDFSSIKKGFCKVNHLAYYEKIKHSTLRLLLMQLFFFFFVLQPREEMNFTGKYKTGEQILRLTNERFAVPEMLFHPSDIGIQEMGIPEALVNSINNMPEGRFHLALDVFKMLFHFKYSNICLLFMSRDAIPLL